MSRHSCLDATSNPRHRHSLYHYCTLAIAVLLLAPAGSFAQSIVDPTTAEFDPSADHNVTISGVPVVDHYEIGFYLIAAAQPFQVNPLGKPSPGVDGKIRVALGPRPAPGVVYEARVSAVGPGGAGLSAVSNDFTFSAPPPCGFTVSPTAQAMAAGTGAAGVAVTVTSGSGCSWTASESLSWVTITSGASGTGNGTANYSVTANTSTMSRTGTLTVAGQPVTITQSAACGFTVSPTAQAMAAGTGAAGVAVTVTSGSGCAWTASESLSWVTITSGASGTGSGTVNYSVTANTSTTSRTGTLTVAGQPVTIAQSGACNFSVSPTSQAVAADGDVASVTVTTTSGCAWTATESLTWLTITNGGSGTGSGTVSYSVSANTSTAPRTGTLTVAGQAITITQETASGAPDPPSNLRIISRAEQGPSYRNRWGGIGGPPTSPEDNQPVATGWVRGDRGAGASRAWLDAALLG
jgi:hypothetical protein